MRHKTRCRKILFMLLTFQLYISIKKKKKKFYNCNTCICLFLTFSLIYSSLPLSFSYKFASIAHWMLYVCVKTKNRMQFFHLLWKYQQKTLKGFFVKRRQELSAKTNKTVLCIQLPVLLFPLLFIALQSFNGISYLLLNFQPSLKQDLFIFILRFYFYGFNSQFYSCYKIPLDLE